MINIYNGCTNKAVKHIKPNVLFRTPTEDIKMKAIVDGKAYNTETSRKLMEFDHYSNGNYSGTTYIAQTPKGALFSYTEANGQDCYLRSHIFAFDACVDGFPPCPGVTDAELIALGLFEEA